MTKCKNKCEIYWEQMSMIVASAISIISAMIIVVSKIILNMKNLKLKRGIKIYLVLILFKTKAWSFYVFYSKIHNVI